jgi:hypothetical protein
VLDNEGRLLSVHDETLDNAGSDDTLLGVEVGGGLVDQVDIRGLTECEDDGHTLQFSSGQVLDLLVDEVVDTKGLVDVGLELGVQERGADLLEKKFSDGSGELGVDLLRLHRDAHLGYLLAVIGLLGSRKHSAECRLSGAVLSHHDNNLRVCERTGVNAEVEVSHGLLQLGVSELPRPVDHKLVSGLGDSELQRFLTETQVLSGDVTIQENIDSFTDGSGQCNHTVHRWLSVKHANKVGQVVQDRQIVLDDDNVVIRSQKVTDGFGSLETLLDIEIRRRLVEHIPDNRLAIRSRHDGKPKKNLHICLLDTSNRNSESLQLSTRKLLHITLKHRLKLQNLDHLLHVVHLALLLEQRLNGPHRPPNRLRQLVDILRLDNGLQIVLHNLGQVVLQLTAAEVLERLVPVGRIVIATQIRLLLSRQDLERRRLSDTVRADETEDLTRTRRGETVQLEGVCGVTMGDLGFEVGRQVDNVDRCGEMSIPEHI